MSLSSSILDRSRNDRHGRMRLSPPAERERPVVRGVEATWWRRVRLCTDTFVIFVATAFAMFVSVRGHYGAGARWIALSFPFMLLALLYMRPGPDDRMSQSALDTGWHIVSTVSLCAMLTTALEAIFTSSSEPLSLPLRLWTFTIVYLGIERLVLRSVRRGAAATEALSAPTLILGAGVVGQRLTERLMQDRTYGLRPIGLIDTNPLPSFFGPDETLVPHLGGLEHLMDIIDITGVRTLVLAFSRDPDHLVIDKVEEARKMGISVLMVPRLYEMINERSTLDHVGGIPVLALRSTNPHSWEFWLKHAFDRTFAALALLLLSPVMLAATVAVKLSSPGPILFRQRRVGRDGRAFEMLKFRSMRVAEPDAPAFVPSAGRAPGGVEGVDRRTRVGAFLRRSTIDELPQLFNVLRGDMSLVGPRPERPDYVAQFVGEINRYDRRHRVKSGMTGWAQVQGLRGQTSISDRVEWDNFYIQNWSLWLDVKILALTVAEVLRGRD